MAGRARCSALQALVGRAAGPGQPQTGGAWSMYTSPTRPPACLSLKRCRRRPFRADVAAAHTLVCWLRRASVASGARRTADGPGPWAGWPRGRRTRLATHDSGLAAAERLPLAADVAPPGQSTHRRDDRKSSGPEPDWRWLGTAVARLDPSKWRAAATRTSCEITGSRAGSGGDPAVRHATGCVGWPTAPVAARGLFVGHRQTCTSGCTPSLRPSQWTLPGCWLAHSC